MSHLFRSVFAISRSLPFTDEAAKEERKNLFSMCTQFNLPALFITITPEDSDNFRLYVQSKEEIGFNMNICDEDVNGSIDSFLAECSYIRVTYPGFCEFEFETILDLVINEIFGWDEKNGCAKPSGGAFGKCIAWFAAIEEQGRKTLHSHFLLWLENWTELLQRLYSSSSEVRELAAIDLTEFANGVVSSKCFATAATTRTTYGEMATSHICSRKAFVYPRKQILRNMRFQHCSRHVTHQNIVGCETCKQKWRLKDLTDRTIQTILSTKLDIDIGMHNIDSLVRYILCLENSGHDADPNTYKLTSKDKEFLLQSYRNLHKQ